MAGWPTWRQGEVVTGFVVDMRMQKTTTHVTPRAEEIARRS